MDYGYGSMDYSAGQSSRFAFETRTAPKSIRPSGQVVFNDANEMRRKFAEKIPRIPGLHAEGVRVNGLPVLNKNIGAKTKSFLSNKYVNRGMRGGGYALGFSAKKGAKSLPLIGKFRPGFGLGLAFTAYEVVQGYREGGVTGAIKAGAGNVAGFVAMDMMFASPLAPVAIGAYLTYKGSEFLAEQGREARKSEFVGSMTSFSTKAAYTIRQRAVQEIARSHTSSRTILGQEAQFMHL